MKVGKALHIVILALAVIWLACQLIVSSPGMQKRAATFFARFSSSLTNAGITVDKASFAYPFGMELEGLTMFDETHDTLFHAALAMVCFKPLPLLRHELSVAALRIVRPDIRITVDSLGGTPNYAFLLSGGKQDTTVTGGRGLELRANYILLKNASISYNVKDQPLTPGVFNPSHIGVTGLSTAITLGTLNSDTLSLTLRNLSAREQSGLHITGGHGVVRAGRYELAVRDFRLETENSRILVPQLFVQAGLAGGSHSKDAAGDTADTIGTAGGSGTAGGAIPNFEASLSASLTGRDFKAIYPKACSLGQWNASMQLRSKDGNISIEGLDAGAGNHFQASGNASAIINGLKPASTAHASLTIGTGPDFAQWFDCTFGPLGIVLPSQLAGLESSTITTSASLDAGELDVSLVMKSGLGLIMADASGLDGHYHARLKAADMALGRILGSDNLGLCSFTVSADASRDSTGLTGTAVIDEAAAQIMGYSYHGLTARAKLEHDNIGAVVNYSDINGSVSIAAGVSLGEQRDINASVNLDNINLAAYSMGRADSLTVSGRVSALLHGSDIDNATGRIDIDSVLCTRPDGRRWAQTDISASLTGSSDSYRALTLNSNFMHASIIGAYRLSTLAQSFVDMLVYAVPAVTPQTNAAFKKNTNSMVLKAQLSNLDFMDVLLDMPVTLGHGADVSMQLCDESRTLTGSVDVPALSVGGYDLAGARLTLDCDGDSVTSGLDADLTASSVGHVRVGSRICALARDPNMVRAGVLVSDSLSGLNVPAALNVRLGRQGGALKTKLCLEPSTVSYNGSSMEISMDSLTLVGRDIQVSRLLAMGVGPMLWADGRVSASPEDRLNLEFRNIDLAGTLAMLGQTKPEFQGLAGGSLQLSSLLGRPEFQGTVNVDSLWFHGAQIGNLSTGFKWEPLLSVVQIDGVAVDSLNQSKTLVKGFYRPADSYIDINLGANHTDLKFLNKWTGSVFSDMAGRTTGQLRLFGYGSKLDLEGSSVLENAWFDVESIGARFLTKHDILRFESGKMLFDNIVLYDPDGHSGLMDCHLTHNHFHNWQVDLKASVNDMLVYDIAPSDKSSFFATVFAKGDMRMTYDPLTGIDLAVTARTSNGTHFGLKPTSNGAQTYEFLTIVDRNAPVVLDSVGVAGAADAYGANGAYGTYGASGASGGVGAVAGTAAFASANKSKRGINIDLNIDCDNSAVLDMSLGVITGLMRGQGNVRVQYDSRNGLALNGLYNLSYGQCSLTLEDLIKKNFTLSEGSYVRFNGSPMETELNIETYHNVNSVSMQDLDPTLTDAGGTRARCLMNVTGTASSPQLSFGVDLPSGTSQQKDALAQATATDEQRNIQFMYLLALGTFYSYDYNSSLTDVVTTDLVESMINNALSGQVDNVLSGLLGSDAITLSSNLSAMSYLSNDPTNLQDRELEGILEAHLLDNRLLINGNFGYRQSVINNTSNFVGDVEVKYLLLPKQGISIKGYNKSNDKYFSKTTLTTQGVGLVFERDF